MLNSIPHHAIINAAANINIRACEEKSAETLINAEMVDVLANESQTKKTPLLHISTDHYYNSGGDVAHKESDEINLVNEYAKQKYAAEKYALSSSYSLVLRTSIVGYSSFRKNSLVMCS